MKETKGYEKVRFMMFVEQELALLTDMFGTSFSDESLRIMKRIYKQLRILILLNELDRIEQCQQRGKITGKQAVSMKAKVKKSWR